MRTQSWARDAIFYHIYPFGLLGAPAANDFASEPVPRIRELIAWLSHIKGLGCTAIYIGPLFESGSHGYDTADYGKIDRRLGSNQDFGDFVSMAHAHGLRVVVDGVFNHVGRDFPSFKRLQHNPDDAGAQVWFAGFDRHGHTPLGDNFSYDTWHGHYKLARLDLGRHEVKSHLLDTVEGWIRDWDIDGIRLDAADCVSLDFQHELAERCRGVKPDFWLLGEIVMGDYRRWAGDAAPLDSVTNYEAYKGLWSSHKDRNFHEIAWTLDREFGHDGLYRNMTLYNFADNHDVDRVSECLADQAQLYPLYALMFAMPGIPSIYYGSEWGIGGKKTPTSDAALRPMLKLEDMPAAAPHKDLEAAIRQFAIIRAASPAIRRGSFRRILTGQEHIAFERRDHQSGEQIIVLINGSNKSVRIELPMQHTEHLPHYWDDLLSPGQAILQGERDVLRAEVHPCWARILRARV